MAASEKSRKMAYNAMLLKVSNRLASEDLRNLRFVLQDDIPAAKLEEASCGTDIFTAMQQKGSGVLCVCVALMKSYGSLVAPLGMIDQDNLGELKKVLDYVERKDLIKTVTEYEDNGWCIALVLCWLSSSLLPKIHWQIIILVRSEQWMTSSRLR